MIGIIGAMKIEVESIEKLISDKEVIKISNIEFNKGKINGKDVVVATCGVGKVFAAICTQIMILNFNPDYVINVGVAGSLSKNLDVASIAIATKVVQHDMDTSGLGDPVGLISGINKVYLEADDSLVNKVNNVVSDLSIPHELGVIASGDQFICNSEAKMKIKDNFNAIACEMEGAAIGQVCFVNSVPFCIIRAISDNADGNSGMAFGEFLSIAVDNTLKVIERII